MSTKEHIATLEAQNKNLVALNNQMRADVKILDAAILGHKNEIESLKGQINRQCKAIVTFFCRQNNT